jgi:hypothetical protein
MGASQTPSAALLFLAAKFMKIEPPLDEVSRNRPSLPGKYFLKPDA